MYVVPRRSLNAVPRKEAMMCFECCVEPTHFFHALIAHTAPKTKVVIHCTSRSVVLSTTMHTEADKNRKLC